jgi:transcriptional regulator GlxA family with amidase domain
VRIDQAKKILVQSSIKMEAVAELCGYQSATSFCMAFKHTTGMTPTQFKNLSCC